MKILYFTILVFLVNFIHAQSIKLFDGKTLNGWHIDVPAKDKNPDIEPSFLVRDGKLVSMGVPEGHIITDKIYENYRLEVEYRFANKEGNCGVLVHSSTPRCLYGMFPKSIEVQMMHKHAGDFWVICEDIEVKNMEKFRGDKALWGSTEGKNRNIKAKIHNEKALGKWNKMVIECVGSEIKVWLNGKMVNHGFNCTTSKGQIALQAEGAEVEFKKIKLKQIKKISE
jgi:hypothetical protein